LTTFLAAAELPIYPMQAIHAILSLAEVQDETQLSETYAHAVRAFGIEEAARATVVSFAVVANVLSRGEE
jgi:hypothetical protein